MKRILIVCAALLLCGMAAARGRGVHRVASCNIRVALPQDEGAETAGLRVNMFASG